MSTHLKDVLHLYLGSECEMAIKVPEQDLMWMDCKVDIRVLHNFLSGLTEVKLHLRTLSSITIEEVHEVESYIWEDISDACVGDKELFLKSFINDETPNRVGYEVTVRATNWFRKNGFDVDELIESGQAINKSTLSPIK